MSKKAPKSLREKLQAILALAEDAQKAGRTEEYEAAYAMLEKLAKQYKISVDSLLEPQRFMFEVRYRGEWQKKLLIFLYSKVLDSWGITYDQPDKAYTRMSFELSPAEHADLIVLFRYYKAAFEEELSDLLIAFSQKHHLYAPPGERKEPPTPEQVAAQKRREMLQQAMKNRASPLSAGYLNGGDNDENSSN